MPRLIKHLLCFATLMSMGIFLGCASSPRLSRFPLRTIDRPYSLPQGVSSWKVVNALGVSKSSNEVTDLNTVFFPFFWEQGLSDSFSMVWFPLPLEFRFQAIKNEKYRLGLGMNLFANILYQFQGFNWTPFLDVDQRFYLSPHIAIDWNIHVQLEIRRSTPAFHYGVLNWVGPLYQINDSTHFQTQLGFLYEYGNPRSLYLGRPPSNLGPGPYWRFPVRLGVGRIFDKQWQVSAFWNAYFLGFSESQNYSNQAYFLELTHFF